MDANVTILIALTMLVIAIFGSAWLNQRQTERIIESLKGELKADGKTILSELESFKNELRAEIRRLDQRMDSIDARLSRVEKQLDAIFKPILPQ